MAELWTKLIITFRIMNETPAKKKITNVHSYSAITEWNDTTNQLSIDFREPPLICISSLSMGRESRQGFLTLWQKKGRTFHCETCGFCQIELNENSQTKNIRSFKWHGSRRNYNFDNYLISMRWNLLQHLASLALSSFFKIRHSDAVTTKFIPTYFPIVDQSFSINAFSIEFIPKSIRSLKKAICFCLSWNFN